jgi:hypothetical protein
MTSAPLRNFSYPVATRAGYIASTTHSPDLTHHVSHPRTLPSGTRHVLFTYSSRDTYNVIPKPYPGHIIRGPTAIHEGSPHSFFRLNFNTKHHVRPIPKRADGRSRKLTEPQSTSSPQRLNYIHSKRPLYKYMYTNKTYGLCTPIFGGPRRHRPLPTHSHHLLHIPTFFQIFSTHFHTSFFRAGTNGLTTQSKCQYWSDPHLLLVSHDLQCRLLVDYWASVSNGRIASGTGYQSRIRIRLFQMMRILRPIFLGRNSNSRSAES